MANPQKENGNTQIANEILDALTQAGLNGTELALVLHVVRKTYGWHKKHDRISLTQFEKQLNKSRPTINDNIQSLLVKKLLLVKKTLLGNEYGLNKDYTTWLVREPLLVKKNLVASKEKPDKVVKVSLHTKETITKETIQKKKLYKKDLSISLVDENTKQKRKNSAKKKKEYEHLGEFENIKLTKEEQVKLRQRHGVQETENAIVEMSLWLKQNNNTYKDYYAALLNWIRRHKEKTNQAVSKPNTPMYDDYDA